MTRIPYFEPTTGEEQDRFSQYGSPPPNILRMMAYASPGFVGSFLQMSRELRFNYTLEPQLRELAILRVGTLAGSHYEVFHHERIAREIDIPAYKLEAIRSVDPDLTVLTAIERAVVVFTDEVVRDVRASDAAFAGVADRLSRRALQELIFNIGFYLMTCQFLENFDVAVEPETAMPPVKLPERGTRTT